MTSNGKREQNPGTSTVFWFFSIIVKCFSMSHNNIMHMRTSCNAGDRAVQWHHGLNKKEYLNYLYENNDRSTTFFFFLGFTLGNIHVSILCWIYPFFTYIDCFLFLFLNITCSVVYEIRSSCDQKAMFILQVTALRFASQNF